VGNYSIENDFRTKRFFMRPEKYYYNTQTLRYEKIVDSPRMKILKIMGIISGILLAGIVSMSVISQFYASPKELALQREINQMDHQYTKLKKSVASMTEVLENIKQRDANVHRMVFGMDPIDENIYQGGVGGHDKYAHFTKFKNSGEALIDAQEKVDRLTHQLVVQSKSLDDIENMANQQNEEFAAMPLITPVQENALRRKIHLLSGFGKRLHPIYKVMKMHDGIDFTADKGTPIQATGDGKIITAKRSPSYGRYVVIRHNDEYETLYAHMDKIMVKKGQKVKRGEQIGTVGSTGRSTAPHLHYEVRYKGRPVNPISYCMDGLSAKEYEQLVKSASQINQSLD